MIDITIILAYTRESECSFTKYQDMHYIDAERSAGIPEEMKYNHVDEYASEPFAENKQINKFERLNIPIIKMKTICEENSEETIKTKAVHKC